MLCDHLLSDSSIIPGMEKMHETTARLFAEVAKQYGEMPTTSEVARRMNIADNNVTNWKERGISFKGAVLAEAAFGVPASYILFGERPPIHNTWPFAKWIDYERIRSLDRDDLIFIAGKLDAVLQELEKKR